MSTNIVDAVVGRGFALDQSLLLPVLLLALVFALALLSRLVLRRERRLAPPEVQERIDSGMGLLVLDVRPRSTFAKGHIEGAVNVPLSGLRAALSRRGDALPVGGSDMVVVVADVTRRAERAADRLRRAGFERVYVMEGGMHSWQQDRLPLAHRGDGGLAIARH